MARWKSSPPVYHCNTDEPDSRIAMIALFFILLIVLNRVSITAGEASWQLSATLNSICEWLYDSFEILRYILYSSGPVDNS